MGKLYARIYINRMSNCWCQRAIIKRPVACFPNTLFIACQKWPAGWVIVVDIIQ